jgi:hypothetical protein
MIKIVAPIVRRKVPPQPTESTDGDGGDFDNDEGLEANSDEESNANGSDDEEEAPVGDGFHLSWSTSPTIAILCAPLSGRLESFFI